MRRSLRGSRLECPGSVLTSCSCSLHPPIGKHALPTGKIFFLFLLKWRFKKRSGLKPEFSDSLTAFFCHHMSSQTQQKNKNRREEARRGIIQYKEWWRSLLWSEGGRRRGEGGDTAAHKTRASNPTAAAGSLHATIARWINSLWRALLSVGRDEHCPFPPLLPPLYHDSPYSGLSLPSPSPPAQSLECWWSSAGGWCCRFEVTDGRVRRQLSFVARRLGRPLWVIFVRGVMSSLFGLCVSKWVEGGGVERRAVGEASSDAASRHSWVSAATASILRFKCLQQCDVSWRRITFDPMTAARTGER